LIVYFDTSALVKRYIAEAGSAVVCELWDSADSIASSQLLYAEMIATFARKRREQPAFATALNDVQRTFRDDWNTFYRIPIDDAVNERLVSLLATHALRGADAVHLASALVLRGQAGEEVTFACADDLLTAVARAEGLTVAP
jgi:uncharacterized protein